MRTPLVQEPVRHPLLFFVIIAPTAVAIHVVLMGDAIVPALGWGTGSAAAASAATWLVNPQNW